jgi:hypothetical protein
MKLDLNFVVSRIWCRDFFEEKALNPVRTSQYPLLRSHDYVGRVDLVFSKQIQTLRVQPDRKKVIALMMDAL